MHTSLGTSWTGVPTPLDKLHFLSIAFGPGAAEGEVTLLIGDTGSQASFVLRFANVEAISGYGETTYWTLAEEPARPQHAINLVHGSTLLARMVEVRPDSNLNHFLVCGGNMCVEIIASDGFALEEYPTNASAATALAQELEGIPTRQPPLWRSTDEAWA